MNQYKFTNKEETGVRDQLNGGSCLEGDNRMWRAYLDYVAEGGETDPFMTHDEYVASCLADLKAEYENQLSLHPDFPVAKLTKALRKETKGNSTPSDKKILDDNDIHDDWKDQMETRMEEDETWIEDPSRTIGELQLYSTEFIAWPVYPF